MKTSIEYKKLIKLPSVYLKIELIAKIEEELKNLIDKYFELSEEYFYDEYKISIKDSEGILVLNSIKAYKHNFFEKSTKNIKLSFWGSNREKEKQVNISIDFSRTRFSSDFDVNIKSKNSQDEVNNIIRNINDIINKYKRRNSKVLPYGDHGRIFWATMGVNIFSLIAQVLDQKSKYSYEIYFIVICFYFYFFSCFFRSYTVFDNRDVEKNEKWEFYGITSFITFVLFGTIATYFRKKLIGW